MFAHCLNCAYINYMGSTVQPSNREIEMSQPTIATVLADAKKAGFVVTKSSAKVNGATAYKVEGKPGLFTKTGLMQLIGIYG